MGVWIETTFDLAVKMAGNVTPFVGVWIETSKKFLLYANTLVTPFVGVWIETMIDINPQVNQKSHPSWVCGLKLIIQILIFLQRCHTLRGCVD